MSLPNISLLENSAFGRARHLERAQLALEITNNHCSEV